MRLPKAFRLDAEEVRVRRQGRTLVLEPVPRDWSWLAEMTGDVDSDWETAAAEGLPEQDRPALDEL